MRALVLGSAAVVPSVLTGLTAWAATDGDAPLTLVTGLLAALWWTAWAFLAAWVTPRRPKKKTRWTAQEAAALDGGTDLKSVVDAAPRRKGKR